jgi:hypothetical protein
MTMLPATSTHGHRLALAGLYNWLLERDYSQHCREAIVRHAGREGHLEECPELEPEDKAAAYEALAGAFEPVPYDSPEWGEDDDLDIDPTPDQGWYHPSRLAEIAGIPPLSGGAPEPFEPTAEDLADYGRWLAQLERTRPWYERNSIEQFNADA